MRPIYQLNPEFVGYLDEYKDWVLSARVQDALLHKIEWQNAPLKVRGTPQDATSLDYLMSIPHDRHDGFPPDQYGINLNYGFLKKHRARVEAQFFEEIREMNAQVDENLQNALGARFCALKMYYPADGYIAWHTNWNVPGYNIVFTYSPTGNGHWRHIDSTGANTFVPNPDKLVHIDDVPGWHCKIGYFGKKEEADKIVWHSAYTREPRLTVSYVLYEKAVWENMIEELTSQ